MATGGANLIALLSDNLLSCEICQEEFDSHTRPPKILRCYHSYCGVCVEKLCKDGRLRCPKCRLEMAADKGFPMDTTRVALMDLKQSVQSQEGVACQACTEGGKATSRCQDCAEFLCNDCTSHHRRLKKSKDHSVISVSEAVKSPEKLVQVSEMCDQHADKKLELFCLTCSKAVCALCVMTQHSEGHKFVEVEKVINDKKQKVLSLCEQLDQAQETFGKKVKESKASLVALDSNHRKAESCVKEKFARIVSTAMEKQAVVLTDLTAKVKSDRLLLEEQLANFQSLQGAAQTAADYGRRMVSLSLASEILNHNAELEKAAAELKKNLAVAMKQAPIYKVGYKKLEELKSLMKSLNKIDEGFIEVNVETQKERISCLRKKALQIGDEWYLVNMIWFGQWKKYVGYDSGDADSVGKEKAYPGPIDNLALFKDDGSGQLRAGLTDNKDYILVPQEGWQELRYWFGLVGNQQPIARRVIMMSTSMSRKCLKVEVYLLNLSLCQKSVRNTIITKQFSRTDTVEMLEKEMKSVFNIPCQQKVQICKWYQNNTRNHLSHPEQTLQDAGLSDGSVISIE